MTELPNLPESPETVAEWQEAVDAASIVLNLAYAEHGGSAEGKHQETIERAFDLIERGQALGIEPREEGFEGG